MTSRPTTVEKRRWCELRSSPSRGNRQMTTRNVYTSIGCETDAQLDRWRRRAKQNERLTLYMLNVASFPWAHSPRKSAALEKLI